MSGGGGKEAAAGASPAAFCKTLAGMLGDFQFAKSARISVLGKKTPEQVLEPVRELAPEEVRELAPEEEMPAFLALVRLAFELAHSGKNIKPEELAADTAIWTRLVSEFGVNAGDVDALRDYAKQDWAVQERAESIEQREGEWAHASFTEYAFLGDAHKHLHRDLKKRCQEANASQHYSPYVAVVQASGVGKSRAVMQLSELGVYICYCSLAPRNSSASPPRTGKLADRLSTTHDEYEMVLYFKAWLKVLGDSMESGETANVWKEKQLPSRNGSPRGDVAERVREVWEGLAAEKRSTTDCDTWHRDALNSHTCEPEVTSVMNSLKSEDPCSVLFVFDEARGLQIEDPKNGSPFSQARRALRLFFGKKVFFAVFLDTAARVSNLLPNKRSEDSERALKVNVRLLKPIYCLPNMAHCQPSPGLTAQEYWEPEKWLLYGRPLWGARWEYNPSASKLLGFAEQKLLGTPEGLFEGMQVNVREGKMTQSQAIALLSAAAGLSICARSFLAERLAASHMNLILRVTDGMEQRRVYVGLTAEPILAEAAGFVLRDPKVQEAALGRLDEAYLAGHVTPGPRGEFVTKFILVAAVWEINKYKILRQIAVDKYLETLLGKSFQGGAGTPALPKDAEKLRIVKERLPKDGFVFFNSFVIIRRVPEIADLGKAVASGYAFMYIAENRFPGADMVIPVWTPEGMTAIVVSAKNMQKAGPLEKESVDKVKSGYTGVSVAKGLPCIMLLMSLRERETKAKTDRAQWPAKDDYIHLSCYGVDENYSFLHSEVKKLLKKVLVTVPDELSDATNAERECIESMLPAQFDLPDKKYTQIPCAESAKRKGTSSEEGAAGKRRKVGD